MTLCQPLKLPEVGGGGYRFLALFEKWLAGKGHRISRVGLGSHAMLINGWSYGSWRLWLDKTALSIPVIHRVDGSGKFYGRDDGWRADRKMAALNRLADLTIHQSQWSRDVLLTFGLTQDGPIISNPVDLDAFRCPDPCGLPWDIPHVAVVSWSDNPMKGAAAIQAIINKNPNVAFDVVGRMPLYGRHVSHYGVMKTEGLVAILRSANALLTMSEREACPNHVLEAMACGLPILYRDSGATAEVVRGGGLPVTTEPGSFSGALDAVLACGNMFGARARATVEQYHHPDVIFAKYLDAIQSVL